MSIAKIMPTTKVKEWVKRINFSFEEVRRRELSWQTKSVAGQAVYEFALEDTDPDRPLRNFDESAQYSVQYGGVTLLPEDYALSGNTLTFVNGPALESDYPIIVRWIGRGEKQSVQQ